MFPSLRMASLLLAITLFPPAWATDRNLNVSGLWLDAERAAQGLMVEQIDPPEGAPDGGDTRVVVSWFTWAPASDPEPGPRWLYGIGRRDGATVVVDPVMIARSGAFPDELSSAPPDLENWGRLEIQFRGERLRAVGATLRYEGPEPWGDGERQLNQITASGYGIDYGTVLDPPLPNIGAATGNYSSPPHPGQGWVLNPFAREDASGATPRIRVEALLIWYTYDGNGRPTWLFGLAPDLVVDPTFELQFAVDGGTFEGGTPRLAPWGEARLFGAGPPTGFQVSCNAQAIQWTPTAAAFGEGSLLLRQITGAYLWNMGLGFCFGTGPQ
jgi:hypothetical protein